MLAETPVFDVIIIGGGHAGIEAALAASRLHCQVLVVTMSIDTIGLMPCNPSIGGPAKGQMVGEVDALGGEMGVASDQTQIQMKVLNRSRGPAVQCLRAQNDKVKYNAYMRNRLKEDPNIHLFEGMIQDLVVEDDCVKGVMTKDGQVHHGKTVVITTGTFLNAIMHTGEEQLSGGRVGEQAATGLSDKLKRLFRIERLKTGTPPRLHKDSIAYDELGLQPGDPEFLRFSFKTPPNDRYKTQVDCYISHTNQETHDLILANLHRAPIFSGQIEGTGPRYCPSIEDKVDRFKHNPSHHIFIEPEGLESHEIYPAGLNTSLPADIQDAMLRTMPGLKNVEIVRYGYAVEYDFIVPNQLYPTLETKALKNLYFAGQINGTSGYEEAAGQGLIAGANAALKVKEKAPLLLKRENSYIGTLIDDLNTKEILEPYRMMTSRSEYRLLLRQDNALFRLGEIAYDAGLIGQADITEIRSQLKQRNAILARWRKETVSDDFVARYKLSHKIPKMAIAKRPEMSLNILFEEGFFAREEQEAASRAMVELKYEGYLNKQRREIEKLEKWHNKALPSNLDYSKMGGLKVESREKLLSYQPKTLFEAQKIAGINPADLMVVIAYLER